MTIQNAYNSWAEIYDSNQNKTRDLEKEALIKNLSNHKFNSCLEIGCGTGKNSRWLLTKATDLLAVDFSIEMLAKAKEKINSEKVHFIQADINSEWSFVKKQFDLVIFSLVLEHIENLDVIFNKTALSLKSGGLVYIGELHPFKQYSGSKARYETENGTEVLTCFTHHISDFTNAALSNGFEILQLNEYFDEDNKVNIPRVLTLLLRKK